MTHDTGAPVTLPCPRCGSDGNYCHAFSDQRCWRDEVDERAQIEREFALEPDESEIEFIDWHPTPEQLEEQRRRYFKAWENVCGTKHPEDTDATA